MSGANKHQTRVLVVDDDRASRELLGALLVDDGQLVELAADGEIALARLEAGEPRIDVALLDWLMPKLDGFGLLAKM